MTELIDKFREILLRKLADEESIVSNSLCNGTLTTMESYKYALGYLKGIKYSREWVMGAHQSLFKPEP